MLPQLRKLEEKYGREMVIVGVESGKFPAERITANVRQAVLRLGIEHPVVNDRHFRVWRSYAVNAWPTLVLVDPAGYFLGARPGEMTAEMFDPVIARLVQEYDGRGILDRRPLDVLRPEQDSEPKRALAFPGKVLAARGRLYIADSNHNRIVVAALDESGERGQVLEVIGRGDAGLKDGGFANAVFQRPQGMALRGDVLYVADSENHAVRAVDLARRQVRTVAGTGEQGRHANGAGPGKKVALNSPWDVAVDGDSLYIAMAGAHQLWRLNLATGEVRAYAGNGAEDIADGTLAGSALAQPMGLASDGRRLYFADSESSAVRWAALPPDDRVQTIVGTGLFKFGDRDGIGDEVRLQHAQGIALADGLVYIADTYNNKIKTVDPSTRQVTTLLGEESAGYRDGSAPLFDEPGGLSIAGDKIYIADTNNHAIRVADRRTGSVVTLEIRF